MTAADVLAESTAAEAFWLNELESGKAIHVSDDVYERARPSPESSRAADGPFNLPESFTVELWLQYDAGTGETIFCGQTLNGSEVLQSSRLDSQTGELVVSDAATGEERRYSGGVPDIDNLRSVLAGATEQASTSPSIVTRDNGSLGRPATVIRSAERIPAGAGGESGALLAEFGSGEVERNTYFDTASGEQFASERRFTPDVDTLAPVLLYQRIRTIEVIDGPPPCVAE